MRIKIIIAILLLVVPGDETYPQAFQPYFKTYTSTDGLTSSNVNSVWTDHHGYLWIGTSSGLNKFSGNNFLRFYPSENTTNSTVTGNNVLEVLCDSIVNWVTIKNGGLNCYFDRPNIFINYSHIPSDTESLASNNINCMSLAKNGKLFLGTDKGLSIFDKSVSRFRNRKHGPSDSSALDVRSIIESADNIFWLGTNKQGLFCYKSDQIQKVKNIPAALKSQLINDIFYDAKENEIWLATSVGLWNASISGGNELCDWRQPFKSLETINVSCVEKNTSGEIWVGTLEDGLFRFDEYTNAFHYTQDYHYQYGLISNNINDIYFTKDGTAWISTSAGLQCFNKNLQKFPGTKTNLQIGGKSVKATPAGLVLAGKFLFAATDKGIWYSDTNFSKSKSIIAYNNQEQLVSLFNPIKIGNGIFVTSNNGLYEIQNINDKPRLIRPAKLKKFETYTNKPCYDYLEISDYEYCLASSNGKVYVMNIQSGNIDSLLLLQEDDDLIAGDNSINTRLFKTLDQKLLVGTNYCIAMYNIKDDYVALKKPVMLNAGIKKVKQVIDFCEDNNFFWIGTQSAGLFKFDKDLNLLSSYSVNDGLCDNTINNIVLAGNGNLLLATNRGLSSFNVRENKFINYYSQQGLFSQEFQPLGKAFSASGVLFLSTSEGVMKVKPFKQEPISPDSFDIIINKLTYGDQNLTRGDLVLSNESRQFIFDYGKSFSISFEVVNLLPVHQYVLQYRLNDEKQWHDISVGSELVFDRLDPGVHKLYIKGTTDDNNVSLKPLEVALKIIPLYYQQWWFITSIGLLSVFVIFLLYRYRVNQLKRLFKFRTKISQDLHDEIGSTLSGIAMYTHLTKTQIKSAQTNEVEKSLNIMQQSATDMVNKLNDIVWLVNPEHDSLVRLVQRLEEYAIDMAMVKNMQVKIQVPKYLNERNLSIERRRNIFLFFKEAINNAIKYSNGTLLELSVKEAGNILEFSVKDNGNGFDSSVVRHGNGLDNMQKRANEMGAKLTLQSKINTGCFISMQLKIP